MKNDFVRPVYLDLFRIRMPVTAVLSILHRVAGVLLFLSVPFAVYLFGLSLRDAAGFAQVQALFESSTVLRLLTLVAAWAIVHHFCAGVRYLVLDFGVGLERGAARASAWAVFACEIAILALLARVMS